MNLGLEHGINRLAPYSPDWPSRFTAESKKLNDVCRKYILATEHVGSTSIPGMVAKPIVDILIGVEALNDAEKMIPGMESIGYDYPGDIGIPVDRIFGRDPGFRKYLVHIVVVNSTRWNRYIDLRDALRQDTGLADENSKLKLAIVEKHPEGRTKHTELKSEFIRRVLVQRHQA